MVARALEPLEAIGRGASSVVYKARDHRLERDVAVKVTDPTTASVNALGRVSDEIRLVAALRHPNILPLFDAGRAADGSIFSVMPLATGATLRQRLDRGRLSPREALRFALQIANALGYAHERGIVHRAVKPDNILVEDGEAIIADFGIARGSSGSAWRERRDQDDVGDHDPRRTRAGTFVGTPLYASPEQVAGERELDGRSDLFSLGTVLFEMLTGHAAYASEDIQTVFAARFKSPPTLASAGITVPREVEAIIARALAPSPDDRYANAREMAAALESGLVAIAARAPRTRRIATASALLGALAVAAFLALRTPDPNDVPVLDTHRVVVADFDNETGDSAFAPLSDLASQLIATRLQRNSRVAIVSAIDWLPRSARGSRAANGDAAKALRNVAQSARAATVISGALFREAGGLRLLLEVTDARNGELVASAGPAPIEPAHPDRGVAPLGERVAATGVPAWLHRHPLANHRW
jgi:serine/threonine-protein kinase